MNPILRRHDWWVLCYVHTWPGQVCNRHTNKYSEARKQRAIARRARR